MNDQHPLPSLQVPIDLPVVLSVNMGEAQLIGAGLEVMPHRQVAALIMRLNAQVAQQCADALAPPRPQTQLLGDAAPMVSTSIGKEGGGDYPTGHDLLRTAESNRREVAGRISVGPLPDETPDDDYAAALLIVQLALQHLDESVPNGQKLRTRNAYRALLRGTAMLGNWLQRRDVLSDEH